MSSSQSLLQVRQLCKHYSGVGGQPVSVLDRLDLSLDSGEAAAIIGPSGSGKTTLLNIVGTLDRADSGEVMLQGENLGALDEKALATLRNRRLGFIFQFHYLLPQCTVWENVLVPTLAAAAESSQDLAERARRLLHRVGLSERMEHRPGQLSGGERQRVAVVRALINRPSLLLADEPTGALDRQNADALMDLLLDLNREEHAAMLVVTHAQELARRLGRVLELRDGKLMEAT